MTHFFRIIKVTLMELSCHAFRAFLAALGVVLGVGAVIAMMAISEGARQEALDRIREQGIDNIVLLSIKPPSSSQNTGEQNSSVDEYGITTRDVEHIQLAFDNVKRLVPVRNLRQPVYRAGRQTDVQVMATLPGLKLVTGTELADPRGRWLLESDNDEARPICVLGVDAARTLFGFEDPLGQKLSLGGAAFQVVGVVANRRGARLAGAHDLNNLIYIPFATGKALFGQVLVRFNSRTSMERTKVDVDYLYITVHDVEQIGNTAARLRAYLGITHGQPDYEIQVPYELLLQEAATQRIFTIVMASIAAISLLVGGIGIMNIMLANIYERTREIGTRRALGAKKKDILVQFLTESVLLTAIGGAIGLLLGLGIAQAVTVYARMQTRVTLSSVVVSLGVAIMTGVIFGTYPAWKAANLDPIEALRRE